MPSKYVRKTTQMRLTKEQKKEFVRLKVEEEWSDAKLAKHFGFRRQNAYALRIRLLPESKGKKKDKYLKVREDIEFLLSKEPRLTQEEIAQLLDASVTKIQNLLAQSGWKVKWGSNDRIWVKNE